MSKEFTFAPIEDVVAAIGRGEIVVMVDDEGGELLLEILILRRGEDVDDSAFHLRARFGEQGKRH